MNSSPMYIAPEISKKEAYAILSRRKSFLPLKFLKKPLQIKRVELIYLPFYLFEILLTGNQNVTIAVDGLLGDSIFFVKEELKYEKKTEHFVCDFILSPSEAQDIALKEYKWLLLQQGLRSRRNVTVEKITEAKKIFYPFWIGYFLKGKAYEFKAIDALSGQIQGIKMRKLFLKALRQMS